MTGDYPREVEPDEAATVETQHDPLFSLDRFICTARRFGFAVQDTMDPDTTEDRAYDFVRHLMPNATEGDHERFVSNLLAYAAQAGKE